MIMGEAKRNLKTKQEMFAENPNEFIHQGDLLFAILKGEDEGRYSILNACAGPKEVFMVKGLAVESLDQRLLQIRYQQAQQSKGGIVPAQPLEVNRILNSNGKVK